MKVLLSAISFSAIIIFAGQGYAGEQAQIKGFRDSWVLQDINLKDYEAIYVEGIDVRGVKVDDWDPYDESKSMTSSKDVIEEVAARMYKSFVKRLDGVLPVSSDQDSVKDKRAMILMLKLSGTIDDPALLMQVLSGPSSKYTLVSVKGEIKDSKTGKTVVTFSDEQAADRKKDSDSPFASADCRQAWYNTFELWANNLAEFLASARQPDQNPAKLPLKFKILK